MIRDQPADAARSLATELDAELAIGGEATEAALARLRRSPAAADAPPPAPVARRDFEALGQAMRRAEEVRERTRANVARSLSQTINTALAIHPDTLRRAAAELLAVREELDLARRGRPPVGEHRGRRLRAGGSGGITAAGAAIVALGALPVGAAVAAVGVVGGGVTWQAARRATKRTVPGLEAAEGVALRRWQQLAGPDADPVHVDAVVRLYDPQHRVVTDLLVHNPAVRAADQVAAHHRLAWVQAWRDEVGDDGAVGAVPAIGPTSRAERAEREAASAPPRPPFSAAAPVAPAAVPAPGTLVVAAPYADLTEERARALHRRLLALPPGHRVIVVLGPETVTAGPVVDLRDDPVDLTGAVEPAEATHRDADAEPDGLGRPTPTSPATLHHHL
ncbi:hypothetical protein KSP35_17175 [Aquihabitans sp. G128]|uniref:hypothetical protein n=1 Tax=Aquihabitans sp. G128 TaxID=2849779 RepID=UPI001C24A25E|nr:hypothetical protein [Aquihabitans sp. G128]QXC60079.1 hypothetical protein KSP35_17175 [Aquihabitans sp. G128]